jgi:hypothetical protein
VALALLQKQRKVAQLHLQLVLQLQRLLLQKAVRPNLLKPKNSEEEWEIRENQEKVSGDQGEYGILTN